MCNKKDLIWLSWTLPLLSHSKNWVLSLCLKFSEVILQKKMSHSCGPVHVCQQHDAFCFPFSIIPFPFSCTFKIKVTNWCDFCDISLFTFPRFPYMFRAFTSPSSGESSAAVYVLPLGSCSALLFVCVGLLCGLVHRADARRQTTKHYMNQVVTHKQQLKIPLMMGW